MANTIRIKRRAAGVGNGAPSGLANAELAYNEGDNILYYGFGTGGVGGTATQVIAIAGSGAYLNKNNNLSDLNNLQTSRNNLASNTVTSGLFMRGNGTNVLMGSIIASDVPTLNQNTTGNAGSVTNGVYTTGNQTIGGQKTFSGTGIIDGTLRAAYSSALNYNVIFSPTQIQIGQGDINVNLGGNAFYDPNGTYDSTKEIVNKAYVTSTLTGNTFTAGSGLVGGGTLVASRTFDIGQGDGISVSADSIAVDSTVVRTTGNQTIAGTTSFNNSSNTWTILSTANDKVNVKAPTTVNTTYYFLGLDGGGSPPSATSADRSLVSRSTSGVKSDLSLNNVENTALSTWAGSSNITILGTIASGTWNASTIGVNKGGTGATTLTANNILVGNGTSAISAPYSVETTLTGGSSAIPRADAVKTYVDAQITAGFNANDAMQFKGTVGTGGTVTVLPTGTVSAGWTYRVITAGPYAGIACEIGDLIIAVADAAGNVNSTWTVVQSNIDGAVVGPSSATDNALAVYNGTTGKVIKNSSFVPTTVGGNFINLTNPGAIRFLRINADNSVTSLSDTDFRTAIGAGTSSTVGTVTSVAALTLGTTGTDLSSTVASGTITPTITLNVPTASASVRGALSSTDWSTFNNKVSTTRSITVTGTTNQITSSAGSQDLSADRTWTLSLPQNIHSAATPTFGGLTINGNISARATASTNAATQIVVFSGDPSAVTQSVLTRTPAQLLSDIGAAATNQTMFIGTTSVAINRSSASLVLTGITSIDGNAATVTNGVYTTGAQTIGGVKTLSDRPVLNSGLSVLMTSTASSGLYFPVFTSDPSSTAQALAHRTPSQVKGDIGLGNVENTALSSWAGSTNITTLGTIATGTWNATNIAATKGGTGQSSYAVGDLLYADTTTSLAKLADVATGNVLLAGGVSTAPSWGKVGLTTHVNGTLPVANGGTNQTSYVNGELLIGNTTGNTLTKATLTQGSNITITNGNGSITIASTDTNTATAADSILDGSNTGTEITYAPYTTNQAASATPRFYNTNDNPTGTSRLNLSAYLYATNLYDNGSRVVTAATICTDAGNCTWDGGTF